MKHFIFIAALILLGFTSQAQFTTVNFTNNTGLTDLYIKFAGNDGTGTPCNPSNYSGSIGPIAIGTPVTFTAGGTTWTPATPVTNFVLFGFDIIASGMPINPGPFNGLCPTVPSSPHSYSFTYGGGTYTMYFNSPSPGVIDFTLN